MPPRFNGSARPSPSPAPTPRGSATPALGSQTPALGSATPAIGSAPAGLQPVFGINFGNSYASIAVLNSEGNAECIANEDGERQIACAISFHGDEMYVGNQARAQLLKNSKQTIVEFRDLLGKKFSEIPASEKPTRSAPVVQHPTLPDTPAYCVQTTSDPDAEPEYLTVSQVNSLFLKSLRGSAHDFLGCPVSGAVITSPPSFDRHQKQALREAAEGAGLSVLQLLDEAGAVAVATTTASPDSKTSDIVQVQIDLGASSLALQLLHLRHGLPVLLASTTTTKVSTHDIDTLLINFFAKDFTKKNKIALDLPNGDKRAQTLFELNLPFTKRTLSASAKTAASLSIESLKDGYDYTGSINRLRFSMIVEPVYTSIANAVSDLLSSASVDPCQVDEVVLVGGGGCLPGLLDHISMKLGIGSEDEPVRSPDLDSTEVLARGCAVQAGLIYALNVEVDADIRAAFEKDGEEVEDVDVLSKTIGIVVTPALAGAVAPKDGDSLIPVILQGTPIPARRSYTFAGRDGRLSVEVVEAEEYVFTEKIKIARPEPDDDDEEEDEADQEEEVKHRCWRKTSRVGGVELEAKNKGKVTVDMVIDKNGALVVTVREAGEGGAVGVVKS